MQLAPSELSELTEREQRMGMLDDRVAVITGAGRGLGREHALLLAREGAKVVVNDLGGDWQGAGADETPAALVVKEIEALGGEAVANFDNVAEWDGARRIVDTAVDTFGALHVLVNNAGILRDRAVFNMSEEEWDAVVDVHLKGHFLTTRFAAAYWRERHKAGDDLQGRIINTTSPAGLYGNRGQSNYAAAKAGILAMTTTTALELDRYGVKVNCVAPVARTRLMLNTPGSADRIGEPEDADVFDEYHPANVSPVVAMLASVDCPFNGRVFQVRGTKVGLVDGWRLEEVAFGEGRWTPTDLAAAVAGAGWPAEPERRLGVWPEQP
jgi:NAD(P)-dependent dehydrogenase (short-subunit alcohol dehydrogenase family)